MPDYQKGKIYKITSGDLMYIGSTCEPTLAKRLAIHNGNYRQWKKNNKRGFTTAFTLFETGQYEITLIELYPCNSKDELTARERFHIETNVCVNKVIPTRTKKEYHQDNAEKICEKKREIYKNSPEFREYTRKKSKVYHEANKEAIAKQTKLYREANKEEIAKKRKEKYEANKEAIAVKTKLYREANKEAIAKKQKERYEKKKNEIYSKNTDIV